MWNLPRLATELLNGSVGDFQEELATIPGFFQKNFKCYSFTLLGRDELERGNKILLPNSALSTLAHMNVTWPMLFSLSNSSLNRVTYGGVLEFTAEEGNCYLPYWVMKNLLLNEGDSITVCSASLPKGTYVKLQPVTSDFLDISDHRAVLEHALSMFSALTTGDNIVIEHNTKTYEIEIVECKPAPAISIVETDVQVDFLAPKDYVEPERSLPSRSTGTPPCENTASKSVSIKHYSNRVQKGSQSVFVCRGTDVVITTIQTDIPLVHLIQQKSFHEAGNSVGGPQDDDELDTRDIEREEDSVGVDSKKRIPGGVRTYCSAYAQLVESGRCSSFIVCKEAQSPSSESSAQNFSLFGGEGRTCRT